MSGTIHRLRLSRRGGRRRGRGKALLAFAAALLAGGLSFSERGLGSISEELTQEAARGYVLSCVNQAVAQALEEEQAFVTVERDDAGRPWRSTPTPRHSTLCGCRCWSAWRRPLTAA